MLDFPNAPNVGDTFTSGGRVWEWDGVKWLPASTSGTGFLPLNGGTMTGPLILGADPTVPLGAATKEYFDNHYLGGFVNKLRNGTFDIWQRGTSALPISANSTAYTADGWIVAADGVANTVSQINNTRPNALTLFGIGINGAAGLTGSRISQPIESYIAAALAGQICTFQCWIYNNTGGVISPNFVAGHFTTLDTYSSSVADTTITLQSCQNSAYTHVSCTFVANALWTNGGFIRLDFLGLQNGANKNVQIMECDLRITPNVPTGLNNNPPSAELRPVQTELMFCQRYYETGGYGTFSGNVTSGSNYYSIVWFKTSKRATPTSVFTLGGTPISFPNVAPTQWTVNLQALGAYMAANASSMGVYYWTFTASAEL